MATEWNDINTTTISTADKRSKEEIIIERIKQSEKYLEDLKKALEWIKANPGYESLAKLGI
jgi:hypothetical protein